MSWEDGYDDFVDVEENRFKEAIEIVKEDRRNGLPAIRDGGDKRNKGLRIRASYVTRRRKLLTLAKFKKRLNNMTPDELMDRFIVAIEAIPAIYPAREWNKLSKRSLVNNLAEIAFSLRKWDVGY